MLPLLKKLCDVDNGIKLKSCVTIEMTRVTMLRMMVVVGDEDGDGDDGRYEEGDYEEDDDDDGDALLVVPLSGCLDPGLEKVRSENNNQPRFSSAPPPSTYFPCMQSHSYKE